MGQPETTAFTTPATGVEELKNRQVEDISSDLISLCNLCVLCVLYVKACQYIDRVFCRSGRSLLAISRGCNRPIVSWCHEPVAERWSLHPFSINPNSCLAPQSPNSARPGKEN